MRVTLFLLMLVLLGCGGTTNVRNAPETGGTAGQCFLDLHYINDLPGLTGVLDSRLDLDDSAPGLQVSFGAELYNAPEALVWFNVSGEESPGVRQSWVIERPLYTVQVTVPVGQKEVWVAAHAPECQASAFVFSCDITR